MVKKRTKSQRIGDHGERIFALFAEENDCIPSKIENDYGIDFVFQPTIKSSDITSSTFFVEPQFIPVNVKSSESKRPRRYLAKTDVKLALSVQQPFAFALVSTTTKKTYYRFIDIDFQRELLEFLNSSQKKFSLYYSSMRDDNQFLSECSRVASSEYRDRLLNIKTSYELETLLGPISLRIVENEDGNLAIIELKDLEGLLKITSPGTPSLKDMLLGSNLDEPYTLPSFNLKSDAIKALEGKSSTIIINYKFPMADTNLHIKDGKNILSSCKFEVRRIVNENSFYNDAGLSIVISDRTLGPGKQHVHNLKVITKNLNPIPLFDNPSFIRFIKSCKDENYLLCFDADSDYGIPLSNFPQLLNLRESLIAIEKVYKFFKLLPKALNINHLSDSSLGVNFSLAENFIDHLVDPENTTLHIPGFTHDETIDALKWMDALIYPSIVFSLPEGHIAITLETSGKIGVNENAQKDTIAVRFGNANSVKHTMFLKDSTPLNYPKLIITDDFAIQIGEDGQPNMESFDPKMYNISPENLYLRYRLMIE